MKNTELLFNPSFPLSKKDFEPVPLHYVIFVSVLNLAKTGVMEVQAEEIDNFCQAHPAQLEILNDGNFMEFIDTVKELSNVSNYEHYYNIVRKYSLLRDLKERGFDTTKYYDELQDEQEELAKLEKWTIQDILDDIDLNSNDLRNKFDTNYVRDEMWAGEDTEGLLELFEQDPAFGAYLQSPYLTTLYQGWCRGHLLLRSAASGVGKSRMSVGDLCNISALQMWDDNAQDFIGNRNYQGPSFFIHTEMKTREEINPLFLACISGVEYRDITNGRLTPEQRKRVLKAGEILIDSQIKISDMPDFTSQSIDRKIKEMVDRYGASYGVFDYVQLQSCLAGEYKSRTSVPPREDLVLKSLVTDLKSMAEKYNVGILSMTQLNDSWKTADFPDEGCLSGSKSMKTKLDAGSIVLSTKERPKEFKRVEPFIRKRGFGSDIQIVPNVIEYIYKARYGLLADQKVKVWSYFDRGTMRRTDLFCTDNNDEFVKVQKTMIGD